MRRKTAFLVFLGLLCGGTASAQSPSQESGQPESRKEKRIEAEKQEAAAEEATSQPQTLSLQDAVGFAVEHNKSLKASRLNIELQQKMITEAISAGIPQINANLNYQTNFGQSVSMGETGLSIKMEDNFTLGASASWTVLNGEWIVGIQTAKIAKTLASQQVDADALDIKSTIYNSYYTILVCERLVQILQENLDNMSQILEHTQNMYNAGSVEISDVDQIRITVGQLNNSLLSMERTLDVNYNLLRIQLGLKAGTPITLTDRLDDFLGEEGFANLALKDFDINNNLQYQLTLTQEELQKKAVSAKKWAYAPTLSAGYNYQYQIVSGGFMYLLRPPAQIAIGSGENHAPADPAQQEPFGRPAAPERSPVQIRLAERHRELQPPEGERGSGQERFGALPSQVQCGQYLQPRPDPGQQQLPGSREQLHFGLLGSAGGANEPAETLQ